ncbi:21333_t:CDS:2 [Entrophospora sp. SA101]|nr:21333_t:CDS:2 [Entrophospora sp. SA101]
MCYDLEIPKWRSFMEIKELVINEEGSYVYEVLSPLLNIAMRDLLVNIDIWGIC